MTFSYRNYIIYRQSLKAIFQLRVLLKPGSHMIATIAAIADEKKVQRSMRSCGNHSPAITAITAITATKIPVKEQRSLSRRSLESGFHINKIQLTLQYKLLFMTPTKPSLQLRSIYCKTANDKSCRLEPSEVSYRISLSLNKYTAEKLRKIQILYIKHCKNNYTLTKKLEY